MQRIILILVIMISLSSCERSQSHVLPTNKWMSSNGKLKILSTTAMINDVVQAIVGEYADTLTLIQGNLDPHSYQLVKGDDEKLKNADLIFYNGLGLEHGASLHHYLNNTDKAIAVSAKILTNQEKQLIKVRQQVDPHLWMDISLWIETIPIILEQLILKDAGHAETYQENALNYKTALLNTHQQVRALLQQIPEEKRYLVTSHDAFNYFARAYLKSDVETDWQKRFQAPEGLAPDSQLSSSDIKYIIDHLKKYQIEVLFPESNVSQDSIRKIVEAGKEKGLNIQIAPEPLYADSMGPIGSKGSTYIEMHLYNAQVINKYLNQIH